MHALKSLVGWILLITGSIWALFGLSYFAEGVYANITNGKAAPYGLAYIVQGAVGAGLAWGGFRLAQGKRFVLGLLGVARTPK
jgi:hypothetical protein